MMKQLFARINARSVLRYILELSNNILRLSRFYLQVAVNVAATYFFLKGIGFQEDLNSQIYMKLTIWYCVTYVFVTWIKAFYHYMISLSDRDKNTVDPNCYVVYASCDIYNLKGKILYHKGDVLKGKFSIIHNTKKETKL